jgi:hypothetical protein
VRGQQIRLLNDADLKFNRDDEQNESRQRHQIRCHQRDSETERHHRGEDRVAHPTEYTGADQRRHLAGIDSDAPRITHIELRVDRRCDADHRDHDAGGLDPRRVQNAHRRHHPTSCSRGAITAAAIATTKPTPATIPSNPAVR